MRRGRPPGVKKVVAAEPGFQFDEPITQLAWFLAPPGQGLSGKTAIVDNIVLKTVPEPSMLLLFGSAAAMLFAHRRRVKESR